MIWTVGRYQSADVCYVQKKKHHDFAIKYDSNHLNATLYHWFQRIRLGNHKYTDLYDWNQKWLELRVVITTISNIMFYCQKPEQLGKTTDLPQVSDKHHIKLYQPSLGLFLNMPLNRNWLHKFMKQQTHTHSIIW